MVLEYTLLGNSDIKISKICLGTMTYGEQTSAADAVMQLDFAVDSGVNFIDTAELYPVPPKEQSYGVSEKIIGSWLSSKQRDKVVIATKVSGVRANLDYMTKGDSGFSKQRIKNACENSLKRLKTDYIDLYQLHWPSRKTNFFGHFLYRHYDEKIESLEVALDGLSELVKDGKVRQIGVSNETPWGILEYTKCHMLKNTPRIQSIQNPYNLFNRSYEIGLSEISIRENISTLVYSPLAMGVLSGKYNDNSRPQNSRMELYENYFGHYLKKKCLQASIEYAKLAKKYNISQTTLALSFVNSQKFISSNMVGATNLKQLKEVLKSCEYSISGEILNQIDRIHNRHLFPRFSN